MSTLVLAQRGRLYAELVGELVFTSDHRLVIFERLTWETGRLIIEGYSYEAWQGSEKLYWYDSQRQPQIHITSMCHQTSSITAFLHPI